MEEDKTLTGTIQIHFETDGDFGFSDYENINNYGWVIYHEDGDEDYKFTLYDFVGTADDIREKIIHGLFMNVHTSRPYIMRSLCNVFDALEDHVGKDTIYPDFYMDLGNQNVSAAFVLKQADRKLCLEQEIKSKSARLKYYENQILSYQRNVDETKKFIESLKTELEAL